jgi:cyclohexanecarboxylate-CoA ligase
LLYFSFGEEFMSISPFLSQDRIDEMTSAGYWGDMTLIDYFDRHLLNGPDKVAVVDYSSETGGRRALTYRELGRYVNRFSIGLIKLGVETGDVISIQLPNRWEFLALYLASLRIGATINPLMPIFRHRELTYMMGFSEAKVVIVAKTFRGFDYQKMMEEIQPDLPNLKHILAIGGDETPSSFEEKLVVPHWEEELGQEALFAERKLGPNSVTQLLFTSGTTGDPKGVMQISNTLLACTKNFVEGYELTADDNFLMSSPLAHQTGFLVGLVVPIFLGSKTVYQDVWEPDKAIQIVHDEKIHFTMASTPFLSDMTHSPLLDHVDTAQFKTFVTAGAPVPRVVAEEARRKMHCQVYSAYGMTENLAVTLCKPGDSVEKVYATDGVAQKGVELRIVDAEGALVACGEEGQVETRGSYNFCGYLNVKT